MAHIEIRFTKGAPLRYEAFEQALWEGKRLGRPGEVYKVEEGVPDVLLARIGVTWQPRDPRPMPRNAAALKKRSALEENVVSRPGCCASREGGAHDEVHVLSRMPQKRGDISLSQ